MTQEIHPLKVTYDSEDIASGISEFTAGDVLAIEHGGTGASSAAGAITSLGLLQKVSTTLSTGNLALNGTASSFDIQHNLNSAFPIVQVFRTKFPDVVPSQVFPEITLVTINRTRIRYSYVPPADGSEVHYITIIA